MEEIDLDDQAAQATGLESEIDQGDRVQEVIDPALATGRGRVVIAQIGPTGLAEITVRVDQVDPDGEMAASTTGQDGLIVPAPET